MGIVLNPAFLIMFGVAGFLFFFWMDRLSKPK